MDADAFMAGRDLAVQLLDEASAADAACIESRYREGDQDNFVLRYFTQAMHRPELAAGFCAVLSDYLSAGGETDPALYARLTTQEIFGPKHDHALQGFLRSVTTNMRGAAV